MSGTIIAQFFDDVEALEAIADAARVLCETTKHGHPDNAKWSIGGVWLPHACFKPLRLALGVLDKVEEEDSRDMLELIGTHWCGVDVP